MILSLLKEIAEYIQAGGWVMPPLVVATLVLWFAIGYRFATLKRGTERDVRSLVRRFENGKLPTHEGVMVRALLKGMRLREAGKTDLRPYLDDAFAEEEREIRRFARLIVTLVTAAPLLGLLGTVIGMIETFSSLGDMSLFSQSGGIAGGIAKALITTQMGLGVAIPGMIVNGLLMRRQRNIELELAQLKDFLCAEAPHQRGA